MCLHAPQTPHLQKVFCAHPKTFSRGYMRNYFLCKSFKALSAHMDRHLRIITQSRTFQLQSAQCPIVCTYRVPTWHFHPPQVCLFAQTHFQVWIPQHDSLPTPALTDVSLQPFRRERGIGRLVRNLAGLLHNCVGGIY